MQRVIRNVVLIGLVMALAGCDDDSSSASSTPADTGASTTNASAYDNEFETTISGRVMSTQVTGIPNVHATWLAENYTANGGSYNTDTSVSVTDGTTDSNGYFSVVVHWDRDYGAGALAGRIQLTRAGYSTYQSDVIGMLDTSSYSVGEIYPGWAQ